MRNPAVFGRGVARSRGGPRSPSTRATPPERARRRSVRREHGPAVLVLWPGREDQRSGCAPSRLPPTEPDHRGASAPPAAPLDRAPPSVRDRYTSGVRSCPNPADGDLATARTATGD